MLPLAKNMAALQAIISKASWNDFLKEYIIFVLDEYFCFSKILYYVVLLVKLVLLQIKAWHQQAVINTNIPLNINMMSCLYSNFHYKDNTILRPSWWVSARKR